MEGMDWLKERTLKEENIKKVQQLVPIAEALGVTLPSMALAWCLKNENVSTVITGASKVNHLKENLKALDTLPLLTEDVMEEIEKVLDNKPYIDWF